MAQLMKITGAELHRGKPGTVNDFHTAPQRQHVITLWLPLADQSTKSTK